MSITILKYIFSQGTRRLSHPSLIIISEMEPESERKIQNRIHEREKALSIRARVETHAIDSHFLYPYITKSFTNMTTSKR